jgi:hypothetical protein
VNRAEDSSAFAAQSQQLKEKQDYRCPGSLLAIEIAEFRRAASRFGLSFRFRRRRCIKLLFSEMSAAI